jgi:anionic cell wall polymer biosynthesis LytR-Cps2A-Psr (LCP) family protein
VNVQTAMNDPSYGGWDTPGKIGFRISTGKHTLDGETALAFVRSRKSPGDSDFGRAHRQQQLLVALQRKLIDPAMLPNLPGLLKDATKTLKTNFPQDRVAEVLDLARKIDERAIQKYVLGAPYSNHPTNLSTYILIPDMQRIAKLSVDLFGAESRYASTQ